MVVVGGEPEGRNWRRLPRLIGASFRIVWQAAPREFGASLALLVVQGVATGVDLSIIRNVLVALLFISPLLVALSLLGFLPLWAATMRVSRAVFQFMLEMTPNDRKRGYILGLLTDRNMAKEVRAFGLGGYLRGMYEQLSGERLVRLREHIRQRALISGLGSVGSALASGVMFAALAWLITSGHLGLAAAGAAATAAIQLGGSLQGVVFGAGQLYESSLFVEGLDGVVKQLPALRSARPAEAAPPGFDRIEVRDVHFTYPVSLPAPVPAGPPKKLRYLGLMPPVFMANPGGEGEALHQRPNAIRGVSLEIRKGEVIALVG